VVPAHLAPVVATPACRRPVAVGHQKEWLTVVN